MTTRYIPDLLKTIEDFDEDEAQFFFKKLAQQSHDHEVTLFLEEAKKRGKA